MKIGLVDCPAATRWRAAAGFVLLLLIVLPPLRREAELSMAAHMLVQYPGLLLAGGLLADGVPASLRQALQRWNELGIAGLVGAALSLAVLMVPRVLDLALVDVRVETLKVVTLVSSGAALRLSWERAGSLVQLFFLGNVLPMMVVVGTLFQDSATRVCNAYRLDDQQTLGLALVWIAVGIATLCLLCSGSTRGKSAP
jgi:hypothetical protein